MTTDSTRPRIAWLVNLFSDQDEQHAQSGALLRSLSERMGADVVPFYCIDTDAPALELIEPVERIAYTRARLTALLGEHDLPSAEPVILSAGEAPSTEEKADALVTAVQDQDVLFTFVHSQVHSAIDRLLTGSFSETFFARARRPVLILNPHAEVPGEFDTIAFGTDFGASCADAFATLLPIARQMRASIHIEHQLVVRELSPFMKSDATRAQYDAEIAEMREQANAGMRRLLIAAEAKSVPVTTSISVEGPSITPGEGLEGRAKLRGTALVAVAAHGDRKRPGNFGSTALWLIRNARRPVLVIPTHS